MAAIAVARGEEIRRGRGVQAKYGDEAKPLDMARWRGGGGTDEPEGFHRQSVLAGMPVAWSPRELARVVYADRPNHVQRVVPPRYSLREVMVR
jgi:hypothetical protein